MSRICAIRTGLEANRGPVCSLETSFEVNIVCAFIAFGFFNEGGEEDVILRIFI